MIKAFLFDYGGVITSGGRPGRGISTRLGVALGMTTDEAGGLLDLIWDDFATGKISEQQVWEFIEAAYGHDIPLSKRAIWNAGDEEMQPLPEIIELIEELQADGYPVGLVSNVIPNIEATIRENGGYDGFDFLVLSCDVGYLKPDPEIYQLALDKLEGIKPSEVVFIDDQERCLVPARELGIKTILAESPEQIIRDVRRIYM